MRPFLFGIIALMFLGSSISLPAANYPYRFQDYAFKVNQTRLDLSMWQRPDRLTIADLEARADQFASLEDFLGYVTDRSPRLKGQFVLVHDSGSLQASTLAEPRLILFADGLMIGLPLKRRYQGPIEVEIFSFDPYQMNFQTHELVIGPAPRFENNPDSCGSCHGDPLRPIWQPYDFWPSIYGSSIARFATVAERDGYEKLMMQRDDYPALRFLDIAEISNNYNHNVETFTQYVGAQIYLSLAADLKRSLPVTRPYLPALFYVLNYCGSAGDLDGRLSKLEQLVPTSLRSELARRYQQLLAESQSKRDLFKATLVQRYQNRFRDSELLFNIDHQRLAKEVYEIAGLRLFLEAAGLRLQDYVSSNGTNPYFLGVPGNFAKDLLTAMLMVDPEWVDQLAPEIGGFGDFQWPQFDCEVLASQSRERLAMLTSLAPSEKYFSRPDTAPVGRCLGCHESKRGVPHIPFHSSRDFIQWLQSDSHADNLLRRLQLAPQSGGMPPQKPLSSDELASFRAMIERFRDLD